MTSTFFLPDIKSLTIGQPNSQISELHPVLPTSCTVKECNEGKNHKTTTSAKLLTSLALVPSGQFTRYLRYMTQIHHTLHEAWPLDISTFSQSNFVIFVLQESKLRPREGCSFPKITGPVYPKVLRGPGRVINEAIKSKKLGENSAGMLF